MYYIEKTFELAGSHQLNLPYDSPCGRVHGHNWIITVYCKAEMVDEYGMVIDFKKLKDLVHGVLDHKHLNEMLPFNPTAENIAKWITETVPECWKAKVIESSNNVAIYEAGNPYV